MKKSTIITSTVVGIIVVVVLIFYFSNLSTNPDVTSTNPASVNPSTTSTTTNSENPSGVTGKVVEINMTAQRYKYLPGNITVNEGDTVIIHIKSTDVEHGFALPVFGVSKVLSPGKEETIKFVADKKGTFTFFCNVPCGPGHKSMKGTLIVK